MCKKKLIPLFILIGVIFMAGLPSKIASGQGESESYMAPPLQPKRGLAPGMKIQLLSQDNGRKEYAVIFSKGDEVVSGLTEFAKKYDVTSAHFTGIGALRSVTLAWFSPEKKMYKKIPIKDQVEVASLTGNIALLNGNPVVHMHAVVGLSDGTAKAGHILEAHVWPTLEVMVTVDSARMVKTTDPDTGLSFIDP